jgi:guanylate kinase
MQDSSIELYAVPRPPLLVIISGPSGVGKDTIIQHIKDRGIAFAFVVTMTSRPIRANEIHGRDYFFVTKEEFENLIAKNELLEHSIVYGEYKGIPKDQVRKAMASGKDVVMRIDVQGVEKIRKLVPNAVTIFLMPDSEEELIRRLVERKSETVDGLKRRIATAREEMTRRKDFDYVVVNYHDRQDMAVDEILAIISAEHCRSVRTPINL